MCSTPRSRADGHDRGRPRALRRLVRAPGAAAARRGQGADRRDRPDRRAHPRGLAGLGAREGRRRAGRGSGPRGPADRRARRRRRRDRRGRLAARSPSAGCSRSSTTRRTRTSSPTRTVEPYALINGREGWYVASFDPSRESVRHFRLDRIKSADGDRRALRAAPRRRSRPPTSTAGRGPARCPPRAAPASGSPPNGPAGRARSARWSRSSRTAR